MSFDSLDTIPARVVVTELVTSRYGDAMRPLSWDFRKAGVDVVKTSSGMTLKLRSDGGQSPPKQGWVILLKDGDAETGYGWTLYGIPHGAEVSI